MMDEEQMERLATRCAEKAATKAADLAAQKAIDAILPQVHAIANNAASAAVAPLQLQLDQLARAIGSGSAISTAAGSSWGGGGASTAGGAANPYATNFMLGKQIEITGYIVDWKNVEETALIWEEAKAHMDNLFVGAQPALLDKVDLADTADANQKRTFLAVIKIRLKQANRTVAWQVRDFLMQSIEEKGYKIGNKKPYVRLEVEPNKRSMNKQAGIWHGLCEEIGLARTSYKVEYQRPGGKDTIVVMRKAGGRPAKMAFWDESKGWDVIAQEWDKIATQKSRTEVIQYLTGL